MQIKQANWTVDLGRDWDDTIPIMEGDSIVACAWPFEHEDAHEDATSRKNARLIASAPRLFRLALAIQEVIGPDGEVDRHCTDLTLAGLRKMADSIIEEHLG